MVSTTFLSAVLIAMLIYLTVVAVVSGIAIGRQIHSPILALLAGGPTAVGALYGSIFAMVVMFTDDKAKLLDFDWSSLAVLLVFPAAPAFVIGTVTACITATVRATRRGRQAQTIR